MVYRLLSALAFILLLPIIVFLALCILFITGFPVFIAQKRIGKDGKSFALYKFRTMVRDAEALKRMLRSKNEATGPVFKMRDDPRFTPIGKFLSHTGLDELPQLFNILKGDMVFFGPRPLPVAEAAKLKPWMRTREKILPGIISPAVLTGTYHKDFDGWMRSDVEYVTKKSVLYDAGLLIRLVPFAAPFDGKHIPGDFVFPIAKKRI